MPKCSCILEFDFDILQMDCKNIQYWDRSRFQAGGEKTYTLNIKSQSGTKSYTVVSGIPLHLDLGECVDPAVYTFWVDSCTERFTKKAAITCQLDCGWLKAVAKIGKGVKSETIKDLREDIDYVSLIANSDYSTAVKLVDNISRRLRQLECDCFCS